MRILHTADWHIGQTLAGFDRDHEHAVVLSAIEKICVEREVDALIVAGDVFEHQNPSGGSQQLFYETLFAMRRACPRMTIVITAGNHDAAGRLEAPASVLQEMNVHVIGNARRLVGRLEARRHLMTLKGPSGASEAQVLAVSYPTPACLPPFGALATESGLSSIVAATQSFYDEMWEGSSAGRDGLPVIVTGHLHVLGAIESEGAERRILIGGQHAVPASIFPREATYVALGHLHKAQTMGAGHIRYSGSLMPLSATEAPYRHAVTLVTVEGGRPAKCEEIQLPRPVPFLKLSLVALGNLGDHLHALDLDSDLAPNWQPFLQVQLSHDGLEPGYRARVDEIAAGFPVRLLPTTLARRDADPDAAGAEAPPESIRLQELQPLEMFRQAFAEKHTHGPGEAHERAFHEAFAAAVAEV